MRWMRFALLVAVVAIVGHDATYVLGHGLAEYPHALYDTQHDGHWLPIVASVLGLLLSAVALAAWRWWRLGDQLRAMGWATDQRRARPPWRAIAREAGWLCVVALGVFVVQENLEHLAADGGHLLGLGVLFEHGYVATLPAFIAVSIVVAASHQYIAASIRRLEAELARARATLPRAPRKAAIRPVGALLVRPFSLSAQPNLGRAPPVASSPLV